jgi:hypothetical protein
VCLLSLCLEAGLCVISCRVNNYSSAKESLINKAISKQFYELFVALPEEHVTILLLLLLCSPLFGLGRFCSFLILYTVGFLGWGISPSQGRNLHTEDHKHRINEHNTDIHALSGIRTQGPSVRGSEDRSCLRPRSHCNR